MFQGILQTIIPKKDPARTITASCCLGFAVYVAYKLTSSLISLSKTLLRQRAKNLRIAHQKQGIVYLYVFPKQGPINQEQQQSIKKMSKMFSLSAPCMALELFLRINKIPFEEVVIMNPADVSPTERLPVIEYNGQVITDARFIMEFLEKEILQKKNNDVATTTTSITTTSEKTETEEESAFKIRKQERKQSESKSIETAILRIVENLRLGYGRALLVDQTKIMIDVVAREFSYPKSIVSMIFNFHRRETIHMLNQQGYGDLTNQQFQATLLEDVKALEFFISRPLSSSSLPKSNNNNVAKNTDTEKNVKNGNDDVDVDFAASSPAEIPQVENNNDDDKTTAKKNEEKKASEQTISEEKVSQFLLGAKQASKVDCILAAWLKLLRFYDESITSTNEAKEKKKSANKKSEKSKSSSPTLKSNGNDAATASSSSPLSPSATFNDAEQVGESSSSPTATISQQPDDVENKARKYVLLGDSCPAIEYLNKSEIVSEYLKRIDKSLYKVAQIAANEN